MSQAVINACVLAEAVDAVTTLVDEARIRISERGLSIVAVEPANVAMVSMELGAGAFESYEPDDATIAIGMGRLKDILSGAGSRDRVELRVDRDIRKLELRHGCYSHMLSLLDPALVRKEPKLPQLDLPARIVIKGALLRDIAREAGKVSSIVALSVEDGAFKAIAGDDIDQFRAEVREGDLIGIVPSYAKSRLDLRYLGDIARIVGKSEQVTIDLGTDRPVKLSMDFARGNGTVTYLVAPRVMEA